MAGADALRLLGPRIWQRSGETGDREISRRAAMIDGSDNSGRNAGEGCRQADVAFALGFTLGKGSYPPSYLSRIGLQLRTFSHCPTHDISEPFFRL